MSRNHYEDSLDMFEQNFDVCKRLHRNADTSILANPSSQSKEKDKQTILGALSRAGEASCERIEIVTGLSHQSCSPRISELLRDGQIKIVGRTTTISGKPCRLYQCT